MQDLYLKFEDEAQATALLTQVNVTVDAEGNETASEPRALFRNIDTLGIIYEPTGEMLPGWHVNVRVMDDEDASALLPFAVTPTSPRRVWA